MLKTKVEKREICSSKTEQKWLLTLRHLFGLKDDEGTVDDGIYGLAAIFVDRLTRRDIERWRDTWQPRINARDYAATTINDWLAVLRVITKQMKKDFNLPSDPSADVEDVSTRGHRTYTFEQPNSLDLDELNRWFEIACASSQAHGATLSSFSQAHGATPFAA